MFVLPSVYRIVFSRSYQQKVRSFFRVTACAVLASVLSSPLHAANTIVRMKITYGTNQGTIDIELYDDDQAPDQVPKTVANFLRYAGRGDYTTNGIFNGFIHRSVKTAAGASLLIQGGGYAYTDTPFGTKFLHIPEDPPIHNEFSPSRSNVRGTIAMAKIPPFDQQGNPIPGGGPDSATSEWFINLADNGGLPNTSPPGLDYQNGGFTVFGRVLDPGMAVMDAIGNLQTQPLYLPMTDGSQTFFGDLPLANYDPAMGPQLNNLVKVTSIPNVKSTGTIWGTLATFTADPDMEFSAVATFDVNVTEAMLSEFTPPPKNPVKYIAGILYFKATGVMGAGRTITLRHGSTEVPNRYYAYGRTQDNPTYHWYDFTYDGTTGAEIRGDRILLHFVDGQRGDDDLIATNNSITHTGTAVLSTEFVPADNSSGCTIAATPSPATSHGDWIIVSMFLVFIGLVRRRVRH